MKAFCSLRKSFVKLNVNVFWGEQIVILSCIADFCMYSLISALEEAGVDANCDLLYKPENLVTCDLA